MNKIIAGYSVSISELKKNPSALIRKSQGEPIAVLSHNRLSAYLVPAETFELIMERFEDIELGKIIDERKAEKAQAIEVSLDDL
ncbi:MAG: type II toxin-antitoxin system prevent-host-death family antitoxin [Deltaproteobacteria bacterium]|nr:type II toxin-antitoxin system prevent-host-death family antitoxin [Deltaproteobacteria bacterium]